MRYALIFLLMVFLTPYAEAAPRVQKSEDSLASRDAWQSNLQVIQSGMIVQVQQGSEPVTSHWMLWERTPHGRLKIFMKENPNDTSNTTVLVQESTTLVMNGDEVEQLAAPWMLGQFLFGQTLEPEMFLSWTLGLPGRSYSVEKEIPEVITKKGELIELRQSGWKVSYETWGDAVNGQYPSLPAQIRLNKDDTSILVTMVSVNAYESLPEKYTEFSIW